MLPKRSETLNNPSNTCFWVWGPRIGGPEFMRQIICGIAQPCKYQAIKMNPNLVLAHPSNDESHFPSGRVVNHSEASYTEKLKFDTLIYTCNVWEPPFRLSSWPLEAPHLNKSFVLRGKPFIQTFNVTPMNYQTCQNPLFLKGELPLRPLAWRLEAAKPFRIL